MGKTSKWIRNFLTGKKEKDKRGSDQPSSISNDNPMTPIVIPPNTPKEKRRWSFRRSSTASKEFNSKEFNSMDSIAANPPSEVQSMLSTQNEQKQHELAVAEATAAVTDAAVAAAQAAAAIIRLTAAANKRSSAIEEAAAIKIQAVFRSYLARKALCALKGLVKLQALVRGHLVRKQAVTTLRCMQALISVQARARAQRIQMAEETQPLTQKLSIHRKSSLDNRFPQIYNMDRHMEDNIKVVEMDLGEGGSSRSRNSYSTHTHVERAGQRFSPHYHGQVKHDYQNQMSPAPSALTDTSPRTCSGHFEEYSLSTEQSSPQYHLNVSKPDSTGAPCSSPQAYADSMSNDQTFFPNYMANTESFKAKARSQSAPKQRPDLFERQPSRKKASIEGRNIPRTVRMQRSSSHVGATAQGNQFPWSIKLDRSSMSLKDSECGSTSTVLTNTNYCRSLAAYEVSNY